MLIENLKRLKFNKKISVIMNNQEDISMLNKIIQWEVQLINTNNLIMDQCIQINNNNHINKLSQEGIFKDKE